MLIAQTAPPLKEERITATPSAPTIPPPLDRGFVDWGIALAVCAWMGNKLWGLLQNQQTTDTKTQDMLISGLIKQNEILLTALVERKS